MKSIRLVESLSVAPPAMADWVSQQEKFLNRWINSKIGETKVKNLQRDLSDGLVLVRLINTIVEESPSPSAYVLQPVHYKPVHRLQRIENVSESLEFLKIILQINICNISADNIADGNLKLILGLVWSLLVYSTSTTISKALSNECNSFHKIKKILKDWVNLIIRKKNGLSDIQNFDRDWSLEINRPDLILGSILEHYLGVKSGVVNYLEMEQNGKKLQNLKKVFEIADVLGIPQLAEVEDFAQFVPDEKCVVVYLVEWLKLFEMDEQEDDQESTEDLMVGIQYQESVKSKTAGSELEYKLRNGSEKSNTKRQSVQDMKSEMQRKREQFILAAPSTFVSDSESDIESYHDADQISPSKFDFPDMSKNLHETENDYIFSSDEKYVLEPEKLSAPFTFESVFEKTSPASTIDIEDTILENSPRKNTLFEEPSPFFVIDKKPSQNEAKAPASVVNEKSPNNKKTSARPVIEEKIPVIRESPFMDVQSLSIRKLSHAAVVEKKAPIFKVSTVNEAKAAIVEEPILTKQKATIGEMPTVTTPLVTETQTALEEPFVAEKQTALEEPFVAEKQTTVFEGPILADEQAPVLEEPFVAEKESTVLEEPFVAEQQSPVLEEPILIDEHASVSEEPLVIEQQASVLEEPVLADEHASISEEPLAVEAPVLEEPFVAEKESTVLEEPLVVEQQSQVIEEPIVTDKDAPALEEISPSPTRNEDSPVNENPMHEAEAPSPVHITKMSPPIAEVQSADDVIEESSPSSLAKIAPQQEVATKSPVCGSPVHVEEHSPSTIEMECLVSATSSPIVIKTTSPNKDSLSLPTSPTSPQHPIQTASVDTLTKMSSGTTIKELKPSVASSRSVTATASPAGPPPNIITKDFLSFDYKEFPDPETPTTEMSTPIDHSFNISSSTIQHQIPSSIEEEEKDQNRNSDQVDNFAIYSELFSKSSTFGNALNGHAIEVSNLLSSFEHSKIDKILESSRNCFDIVDNLEGFSTDDITTSFDQPISYLKKLQDSLVKFDCYRAIIKTDLEQDSQILTLEQKLSDRAPAGAMTSSPVRSPPWISELERLIEMQEQFSMEASIGICTLASEFLYVEELIPDKIQDLDASTKVDLYVRKFELLCDTLETVEDYFKNIEINKFISDLKTRLMEIKDKRNSFKNIIPPSCYRTKASESSFKSEISKSYSDFSIYTSDTSSSSSLFEHQ